MKHADKIKRIEELMTSRDVIELDALTVEVESFEKLAFPLDPPTLADAMLFRRDQMDETQKEISMRGGMSLKRWKLLESGKQEPSMSDARNLYAVGIPSSVLLRQNDIAQPPMMEGQETQPHKR